MFRELQVSKNNCKKELVQPGDLRIDIGKITDQRNEIIKSRMKMLLVELSRVR